MSPFRFFWCSVRVKRSKPDPAVLGCTYTVIRNIYTVQIRASVKKKNMEVLQAFSSLHYYEDLVCINLQSCHWEELRFRAMCFHINRSRRSCPWNPFLHYSNEVTHSCSASTPKFIFIAQNEASMSLSKLIDAKENLGLLEERSTVTFSAEKAVR